MRESRQLEFKEKVSNTFLKTVSAFANYDGGQIRFGIADDGTVRGISDPIMVCMDIENRINDSIDPVPKYSFTLNEKTSVITLEVEEGLYKPYLYKGKAYRRNDSATIETDRLELTRLILEGQNTTYEEQPSKVQNLQFSILEKKLIEQIGIECLSRDTLKTLELYSDREGYNMAAELMADSSDCCGIDIIRFGETMDILLDRETFAGESVLSQFDKAVNMYRKYYQYERIQGSLRESVSMIPESAFRESIANSLVHRVWDINAHINVAMFSDRIEITSPGGLPKGMTEEEYFRGGISILRNRIIGNIFLRLRMIERFGTGIRRINEAYRNSAKKPQYEIREESIRIILPVITHDEELSRDEKKVMDALNGRNASSSEIANITGFGKSKVVGIAKTLVSAGYIKTVGSGRGLKYSVK